MVHTAPGDLGQGSRLVGAGGGSGMVGSICGVVNRLGHSLPC